MKSRRPVNCYVNVKGQGTTHTNGFCLRCSVYCFNLRETDCYSWPDSMVVTLSWMRPSLTGAWGDPESPGSSVLKHESRSYCVKRIFAEKSSAKNLQLT